MNKTILKKISIVAAVAIIIAPLFSCHPDGPEDFIDYEYDAGNMGGGNENIDTNDWFYPTSRPQELWAGSGSSYDPYIIKTAQDLANLAYMVNNGYSYSGIYFRLGNNIDLNYGISVNANSYNAKEWTSIGNSYYSQFKGNFNGNGYTINGLYKYGLFGYISEGSVQNLTMGTGYIYNVAYNDAGSIAGYIRNTTISNCKNNKTIVSYSEGFLGGLVGYMIDSEISSSSNYANVTSTNGSAGGIVGCMSDSSSISNSYNYATVSSSYGTAGGIAGYADDDNSYCTGCYNSGYVSGSTKGNIIGNRGNTDNKDEGNNENKNDWKYPTEYPNQLWSGSGTYYDPYIIKTAQDLANLAYMVNDYGYSYYDTYFRLDNDIDLNYGLSVNEYSSSAKQWTSIGSSYYPYQGIFDGNNYTIDGLYKNSLFGYISEGSVQNLKMDTGYVYNYNYDYNYYAGSIAKSIYKTTISNCTNNGTIVTGESSHGYVGGLVGYMENSEISSSSNYANVSSTNGSAGGIVGYMTDSSSISNSYNYANVSSSYSYAGGIAGYAYDDNSYCSGCYNTGYVSGVSDIATGNIIGNRGNSENKNENDWSYPTSKPQELWSGNGTSYDPYIIKTAQDLANLAYMVNNSYNYYENTYFELACDIDLNYGISVNEYSSDAKQWISIGNANSDNPFKGKFNGNGYTIKGLYSTDGLFGYISEGSVQNLIMGIGYINNGTYYIAGSIASYIYKTKISNCSNNGTTASYFDGFIGGLVGKMEYSEISDSSNYVDVTSRYGMVGGIVGAMMYDSSISNSYNYANITSPNDAAGGIAGTMSDSSISNSYNYKYANVSSEYGTAGGIVGTMSDSSISNSYNYEYANVSSEYGTAGGIVGIADYHSSYSECYNNGAVSGSTQGNIAGNENDWTYPTDQPKRLWSGNGTYYDPYIIKTAQDLANLSYMVNNGYSYYDTYFRLDNDIDLNYGLSVNEYSSDAKQWISIGGDSSYPFKGNFDGNGYTINGLYNGSLFGYISEGSVENLTMDTGYIYSYNGGSIANYIRNTTISNCTNNGTIVSMLSEYSGGLVGYMEYSEISSSYNHANVSSEYGMTGGIVGTMAESEISSSHNYANVSSTNGTAGGIAGTMSDSSISNSYNYEYANVSSEYGTAGGIVGYADDNSSCSECYNYGKVSGSTTGDIIGDR